MAIKNQVFHLLGHSTDRVMNINTPLAEMRTTVTNESLTDRHHYLPPSDKYH